MYTTINDANGTPQPALTPKGTEVFNTIWGNTVLRGNVWNDVPANPSVADKLSYSVKFASLVSNTSNSFYNFINVR
jgi:hypothetical protein